MELFPHQLKFTFLSTCPLVDYLFCSCGKRGSVLQPRARTCSRGELPLKGWRADGVICAADATLCLGKVEFHHRDLYRTCPWKWNV